MKDLTEAYRRVLGEENQALAEVLSQYVGEKDAVILRDEFEKARIIGDRDLDMEKPITNKKEYNYKLELLASFVEIAPDTLDRYMKETIFFPPDLEKLDKISEALHLESPFHAQRIIRSINALEEPEERIFNLMNNKLWQILNHAKAVFLNKNFDIIFVECPNHIWQFIELISNGTEPNMPSTIPTHFAYKANMELVTALHTLCKNGREFKKISDSESEKLAERIRRYYKKRAYAAGDIAHLLELVTVVRLVARLDMDIWGYLLAYMLLGTDNAASEYQQSILNHNKNSIITDQST